jgi:oxalate decarboxylase/phosphoglucose isomerase-like protein (cupin superfamily)
MKINKKIPYAHEKTWGRELWIENCPLYCGKVLEFDAGTHTSMHFHVDKTETMYLNSGFMELHLLDTANGEEYKISLGPGDSILIPKGQPHKIVAINDSRLFEFSTTHFEEDSIRLSPSYKLPPKEVK